MKNLLRKFVLKNEIKFWKHQKEGVEHLLEYCNIDENKVPALKKKHDFYCKVIEVLQEVMSQ